MTKRVIFGALCLLLFPVVFLVWRSSGGPGEKALNSKNVKRDVVAATGYVAKRPELPDDTYVGSEACRDCHREISAMYDKHPMGQSMAKITSGISEVTGASSRFSLPPEPGSPRYYQYEVVSTSEGLVHRESTLQRGTDAVICQKDVVVDFSVGSGKRGKSYITSHDGVLLMSPLTWYTQGNRWDLSPGYELKNLHFQRRIVDGCVQCHSSRPAPDRKSTHLFEKQPFHELAIGCERCHGPGERHVLHHQRELKDQHSIDPIVNPRNLSDGLGDAVCFQCHLIGESRVTRYGRSDFDFRPGNRVTDIWLTFLRRGAGVDDSQTTEAVSQVEQMLSSTCYKMSEGQMGCVSCHDPHQVPDVQNRQSFFNGKCLECHKAEPSGCSETPQTRAAVSDSCINCHMSSIKANDVPHTSQTDHRVLRRPEQSAPRNGTAKSELHIFDAGRPEIPPEEIKRAEAIQMVNLAESTRSVVTAVQAIPVLDEWVKNNPDDALALDALGTAFYLVDDPGRAEQFWKQGLAKKSTDERFLRRLMFLYHDTGQHEKGIKMAGSLIKVNSWDFEVYGRLAHMYGQTGLLDEGIQSAERAIYLNPSAVEIYAWLANAYKVTGNTELSDKNLRLYESMARDKQ